MQNINVGCWFLGNKWDLNEFLFSKFIWILQNLGTLVRSIYCVKEIIVTPSIQIYWSGINFDVFTLDYYVFVTGARCVATLLHEMKRRGRDCRFGVVSMCIGILFFFSLFLDRILLWQVVDLEYCWYRHRDGGSRCFWKRWQHRWALQCQESWNQQSLIKGCSVEQIYWLLHFLSIVMFGIGNLIKHCNKIGVYSFTKLNTPVK